MNRIILTVLVWSTIMIVAACTNILVTGDNNNLKDDSQEGALIINTKQPEDN